MTECFRQRMLPSNTQARISSTQVRMPVRVLFTYRAESRAGSPVRGTFLNERDGKDSGASVTVYRATSKKAGTIIDPTKRIIFQQNCPPTLLRDYGLSEEQGLMLEGKREKEMLVTVKRSHGVNITESDTAPYSVVEDIRCWSEGKT